MFPFFRRKHERRVQAEAMRHQLSRMEGIEASPKNVQHHLSRQNRRHKRARGNWNSFTYKFTLTPEQEQDARDYCQSEGFDFDAEWRRFNDNNEPSQATTPQQREAEEKWFSNRVETDPESVYCKFMLTIEMALTVCRSMGWNPQADKSYRDYPSDHSGEATR